MKFTENSTIIVFSYNSFGKLRVGHAEFGVAVVLEVLRIQCRFRIQVTHQTCHTEGVTDCGIL